MKDDCNVEITFCVNLCYHKTQVSEWDRIALHALFGVWNAQMPIHSLPLRLCAPCLCAYALLAFAPMHSERPCAPYHYPHSRTFRTAPYFGEKPPALWIMYHYRQTPKYCPPPIWKRAHVLKCPEWSWLDRVLVLHGLYLYLSIKHLQKTLQNRLLNRSYWV